jgi:hypothetical protein
MDLTIKLLEEKILIYDDCIKQLYEIDKKLLELHNDNININVIQSDDYVVVEHGKKLNELNKKEQRMIKLQDYLHNCDNIKKYVDKASNVHKVMLSIYGWVNVFSLI